MLAIQFYEPSLHHTLSIVITGTKACDKFGDTKDALEIDSRAFKNKEFVNSQC